LVQAREPFKVKKSKKKFWAAGWTPLVYPKQKQTEKQLINQNILTVDLRRKRENR
jgi:hypothetical protein